MTREEAQLIARKLHALGGGTDVVRKAAARELARHDPLDATEFLQHLIALSHEGWGPASCVLGSVMAALGTESSQIPYADALPRLAQVQALDAVADVFTEGPAQREMDPGAAAKADATAFSQSLGHMKQAARLTRDPDVLSRLATVSNPAVVRNALINPRLTEPLVVRMAARRPARPEPLIEIWKSRWSSRHAVRRALVFNPYLPPEVGAKIVPLLNANDLEELAQAATLHPSLREQARRLLEAMPGRSLR